MGCSSLMYRSAYNVWKTKYPQGGVRFILFVGMGLGLSVAAFGLGLAYITGIIEEPATGDDYHSVGIGFCIAAAVGVVTFLLAVRWYAHQSGTKDE